MQTRKAPLHGIKLAEAQQSSSLYFFTPLEIRGGFKVHRLVCRCRFDDSERILLFYVEEIGTCIKIVTCSSSMLSGGDEYINGRVFA